MIQLLAIDMDGTCLNDRHRISEANLEALHQAAEAGITVVPTTGRALRCLPHQLEGASFFRYVISSNGACTTDLQTGRELYEAGMPAAEILELLRLCRSVHAGLSAHIGHDFLLEGELLSLLGRLGYGKDARNTVCVRDLISELEHRGTGVEELQLFPFSRSAREALHKRLLEMPEVEYAWDDSYVEVYSPNASKGNALTALAAHLKISRENIACIGDAENDISMFKASGRKYAMGNATDALRRMADLVLPDNNDSGVAFAIRDLLQHPGAGKTNENIFK